MQSSIQNPSPRPVKRGRNLFPVTPRLMQPMIVQRAFGGRTTGSKRPVDKNLIAIQQTGLDATDQTTTLVTVTFPCTIVGLRWDFSVMQTAGTGICTYHWCIVILRDGLVQPTIAVSDGATFYNPEQDVMAFGCTSIDNNVQSKQYLGSTKTMRKMMGGDKLVFVSKGIATNTSRVDGVIQFFCKT